MNTIFCTNLKIAVIFWLYYRNGKTIWYILCDDLTLIYLELCINELLYAHCIKEKERIIREEF